MIHGIHVMKINDCNKITFCLSILNNNLININYVDANFLSLKSNSFTTAGLWSVGMLKKSLSLTHLTTIPLSECSKHAFPYISINRLQISGSGFTGIGLCMDLMAFKPGKALLNSQLPIFLFFQFLCNNGGSITTVSQA